MRQLLPSYDLVMRSSRIARETAQVTKILTPGRRPKTRSSLASYSASADNSALKARDSLDGANDAALLPFVQSNDSRDESRAQLRSSKRKRDAGPPAASTVSNAVTTVSTTTRTSPRKKTVKVEEDVDIEDVAVPKRKKARKQPAKQEVDSSSGEVKIHPPPDWEEVYRVTQEMRRRVLAPVDTMGCEQAGENAATPRVFRARPVS